MSRVGGRPRRIETDDIVRGRFAEFWRQQDAAGAWRLHAQSA